MFRFLSVMVTLLMFQLAVAADRPIEVDVSVLSADNLEVQVIIGMPGTSSVVEVELQAYHRYEILVKSVTGKSDPQAFLNDLGARSLTYNDDIDSDNGQFNSRIVFSPFTSGRYILVVRNVTASTDGVVVSLADSGPIEIKSFKLGDLVEGQVETTGGPVFSADLVSGKFYSYTLFGISDFSPSLIVSAPDGTPILDSNSPNYMPISGSVEAELSGYFNPQRSGAHYFEVGSRYGGNTGRVIFGVKSIDRKDLGIDLKLNTAVKGVVSNSVRQIDYLVELEEGETYKIQIDSCDTLGDTANCLEDPEAMIIDFTGNGIAFQDRDLDGGNYDPLVDYKAKRSGLHLIRVYPLSGLDTGEFNIVVTKNVSDGAVSDEI